MTLTFIWGRIMALLLPQPKERRKNRGVDRREDVPVAYVERYARLRKALVEISNMTRLEMPDDDEFRAWAQTLAHKAITDAGREK